MNKYFTEEETQTAHEHMKTHSPSLAIRKAPRLADQVSRNEVLATR